MRTIILLISAASLWAADVTVKVMPGTIRVGAMYDGVPMRVEGVAGAGSQVVAVIRGTELDEVFNRKGRMGPIWVNAEKVHISGAPSVFFAFSPADLKNILRREAIDRYQLDEDAIKANMRTKSGEIVRASYVTLKKDEGSYRTISNGITMGRPDGNLAPYSADFHFPKKVPPGSYEVTVYECRGGEVIGAATATVKVVETGSPAVISSLARDHGSIYGALAVMAAILAGFGIDFLATRIFKKRVAAH